jgi:peptidoglycan/LPS O-acetylase OafA/YrhL
MGLHTVKKYAYIDALRGWAVIGVIAYHVASDISFSNPALAWLCANGHYGVQLFYIASAITLCMSWGARHLQDARPVRDFYLRRFFRIAPMFYLGALFYLLLQGFGPSYWAPNGISIWFVAVTLAFVHGFHPETINSVVPGGWSIAVEMTFYALFPWLVAWGRSAARLGLLLAFSIALVRLVAWLIESAYVYPSGQGYLVRSFASFNFAAQLPVFLLGMLAYRAIQADGSRQRLFLGSALAIAVLVPVWLIKPSFLLASMLLAACACLLAARPLSLLVNPVTIKLGQLSFSMYLIHFAVLEGMVKLGLAERLAHSNVGGVLFAWAAIAGTAALAQICFVCIEQPGIRWGGEIVAKLATRTRAPRQR